MSYQVLKDYTKYGYNQNAFLDPHGIVIHEPAAPGWTDQRLQEYFDSGSEGRHVATHAGIDWDSITEMVPLNRPAYHVGRNGNYLYLGAELCRPKGHDVEKFKQVWARAIWYTAHLFVNNIIPLKYHNYIVTKENVLSHAEVSQKFPKDTDHTDPVAYFREYGKTMDDFRKDVQAEINRQRKAAQDAAAQEKIIEKAMEAKIITNGTYWLAVIRNQEKANPLFVKYLFQNISGCKLNDDSEIIAATVRTSVITDAEKWTKVLHGTITAVPNHIELVLQRGAALKGIK
jgi:hypothetical protein